MALDEKGKERLAALRDARAKAEEAEREEAEERELAAEELAATLDGRRGEDFAIINNRFGVFALRKPEMAQVRMWERSSEKDKLSLEWMISFLRPLIYPPDRAVLWQQTAAARPGLCWQTSTEFVLLMGVDREALAKK